MNFKSLRHSFIEPDRRYGPAPFFALNDGLAPDRVAKALAALAEKGCSGVFLHPRTGLELPYLSEKFFEAIERAVEECARLGLSAWLYDEYNWPSGTAGGKALIDPDFIMPSLGHVTIKPGQASPAEGPVAAAFAVGRRVTDLRERIVDGVLVDERDTDEDLLIFHLDRVTDVSFASANAPWLDGRGGYVDLLNERAVDAFMRLTHHEYEKRLGRYFGSTIPGIFTDEPMFQRGFPWTGDLAAEFRERKNYDLLPLLYCLVLDRGDFERVRADYYEVVEALAAERYYGKLRSWCDSRGLVLTGHLGMEERLRHLCVNHGGLRRALGAMTMPGVDALGKGNPVRGGLVNMESPEFAPRAAASVSRLTGNGRVLCEAGGGAGWRATPADLKSQLDWLFAAGVNFVVPHQVLLSVKGLRKRDFPPSHFEQEPWFERYALHAGYVARMSMLMRETEPAVDAALLFPITDLRQAQGPRRRGMSGRQASTIIPFQSLLDFLAASHRGFELLFEDAADLCLVVGDRLRAGRSEYNLVVLPPCRALDRKMAELLARFLDAGGRMIAFDALPERDAAGENIVDVLVHPFKAAAREGRARHFSAGMGFSGDGLRNALHELSPPSFRVTADRFEDGGDDDFSNELAVSCREWEDGRAVFVANLGRSSGQAEIELDRAGGGARVEKWDPATGECVEVPFERTDTGVAVSARLGPGQSWVVAVADAGDDLELVGRGAESVVRENGGASGVAVHGRPELSLGGTPLDISFEPPPLPLTLSPEWRLQPERPNLLLIEPWQVTAALPPSPPIAEMKKDHRFSARSIRVARVLRALLAAASSFRAPGSRYKTLRYFNFERAEILADKMSSWLGIDLDALGLYESADLLQRFSDFIGDRATLKSFPPPGAEYTASASFVADYLPDDLVLVYEDLGEPVRFVLNGKPLDAEPEPAGAAGWDPACRAFAVNTLARSGLNRIEMTTRQPAFPALAPSAHSLEPVALAGGFVVKDGGTARPHGEASTEGDFAERGYPFYSGSMKMIARVNVPAEHVSGRVAVELIEVRECAELLVNGVSAGARVYPPFRFEAGGLLKAGENEIVARVVNTAANLFHAPRPSGVLGPLRIIPAAVFSASLGSKS